MPTWSIGFTIEAEKELSLLDKPVRRRIIEKVYWLEKNFNDILPTTLTADLREYFKLRVGDWRVFYQIDWSKNTISIKHIEHRSKAYKKSKK